MKKKKVLIVDDEPQIRSLLGKILKTVGCKLETASDGKEAIAMFRHCRYALTIMDLRMFETGGEEAIEAIEKIDPTTKFLIVTGYILSPPLQEKVDKRIYGFIPKPFDNKTLVAKVKQMLKEAL